MSRKFITGVLAVSTFVTALSVVPARAADPEDVAKFLGVAATLIIIGQALSDDGGSKASHGGKGGTLPKVVTPHGTRYGPNHKPPLPRACLREVRGANTKYVLASKCLKRDYIAAPNLPKACKLKVQGHRDVMNAFSLRCLKERGYRIARKPH